MTTAKKISKLTKEQTALLRVVRDEWIACALNGDSSMHIEAAEHGVAWMYALAKKPTPRVVVTGNPLVSVLAARELGAKETRSTNYMGLGYWSGWTAWCDFYARIGIPGVEDLDHLKQWLRFIRAGVWDVLLFERVAFLSRRPELVRKDAAGRLHAENGPAVRFRDGLDVYSWHGTTIPADWIDKRDALKPELALTHPQIEQRRAAAEIIGWAKILDLVKATVIDQDPDPQIGTLLEADLPDSPGTRFLKVQCGTGRTFVIQVDREHRTAAAANAGSYGRSVAELKRLEIRT